MKRIFLHLMLGTIMLWLPAQTPVVQIEDNGSSLTLEHMLDSVFRLVDLTQVSSGILAERGFQFTRLDWYDGQNQPYNQLKYETWYGLYGSMYSGAVDTSNSLPHYDLAHFQEHSTLIEGDPIPLAGLYMEYHTLDSSSVDDNLLAWNGIQLTDVSGRSRSPYQEQRLFASTPLINQHNARQVSFRLDSTFWFSNSGNDIVGIEVDFDDGQGFQACAWQSTLTVVYPDSGDYDIRTRVTLIDSSQLESHAFFRVHQPGSNSRYESTGKIVNTIAPLSGVHKGGQYTITYGCGASELDKPLIIVQGITLGEEGVSFEGLLRGIRPALIFDFRSKLEEEGYDLVYVEYNDGEDYMERNAYFLQEVIREINALKTGDEENVIMGVSMGGVVTRYALRDMELADATSLGSPTVEDHDCRLYISYDSPHWGGNIPLGLQHMVRHLGEAKFWNTPVNYAIPGLYQLHKMLTSPAARQLLVYNAFNPNYFSSPEHDAFYSKLEAMGMPQNTEENIGLSQGSGLTSGSSRNQGFGPGDEMFSLEASHWTVLPFPLWGTLLFHQFGGNIFGDFTINAMPDQVEGQIYEGELEIKILGAKIFEAEYRRILIEGAEAVDNAPGGAIRVGLYFNANLISTALKISTAEANQLLSNFDLSAEQFSYIPVASGLAVSASEKSNYFITPNASNLISNGLSSFSSVRPVENIVYNPGWGNGLNGNEEHTIYTNDIINWLESNMDFLGDASLNPVGLINGIYNFGEGSIQRTVDRIVQNLEIGSSGKLLINQDQEVGPGTNSWNSPLPGSHFEVSVVQENCEEDPIEVYSSGSGATIEVGDPTTSNTGILRFETGTVLDFSQGPLLLRIHDHSKVIIEPGAKIIIGSGAQIELLGNDAVLEIRGELEIKSGATFGFTGAGFVRLGLPDQPGGLYPNVILDGNGPHGIAFLGSGPTDKVLEIMSDTYLGPDYELDVFSIQGGRVELGEDASINTGYADLTLQNVHFTALDTDQPFKTIFGNGQANHTIDQIEIDHAFIGLNWRGYLGDNASLSMTDSDIHDCSTAIQTEGRSATLDGMSFLDNNTGWRAKYHSGIGSFADGDIDDCGNGISQLGSGHIHVQSSTMQSGTSGIVNQGTGASSATCTDITSMMVGIYQAGGGWIALDNQRNNKISASWKNVWLHESWFPLLYQGKNGLLGTGSTQAVYGTIFYPALVLQANNNQWNSNIPNPIPAGPNPGTSPTSPADYVLSSPQGAVTLSDPGPTAWQACGSGNSGISADWVAACSECPTIATSSYNNVRLDLAINDAMNLLYDSNHDYQAPVAAAYRFHEILTAGYSYTASVTSLLDLVAFRFREAVEAGIAMDSIDTNPAIHSPNLSGLPGLLSDALGI